MDFRALRVPFVSFVIQIPPIPRHRSIITSPLSKSSRTLLQPKPRRQPIPSIHVAMRSGEHYQLGRVARSLEDDSIFLHQEDVHTVQQGERFGKGELGLA